MRNIQFVIVNTPIQLKGTRQGLLLVIREDADVSQVLEVTRQRFQSDASFLTGASLFVDLGWREADASFFEALEEVFRGASVLLAGVLSTSHSAREVAESRGHKAIIGRLGLAKHHGRKLKDKPTPESSPAPAPEGTPQAEASSPALPPLDTRGTALAGILDRALMVAPPLPEAGMPDALFSPLLSGAPRPEVSTPPEAAAEERESEATLYIRRTLRSGARAMYPGHIVVMGDVNPGAELEAEGDIIVIGSLRGKAHAGSAGNESAQVWSLALQPIQLRIGERIWVGAEATAGRSAANRPGGPQKAIVKDGKVCIVAAN